jgi:hypothetical protein
LLALDEQGLDFFLLVGGQVEFAGHALELTVGVHAHTAAAGFGWRGCLALVGGRGRGSVLGEGCARDAEGENAAEC